MSKNYAAEKISPAAFDTFLARYDSTIPEKLHELDEFRFVTVPSMLKLRRDGASDIYLEKKQLQELVEWKMKHGTYRPTLAKLVASNSPEDIRSITQAAFELKDLPSRPREGLNQLTKLKGIGPATASLILSCYDPDRLPFASDELFRWLFWDGKNSEGRTDGIKQVGKGWERQIGYTPKEYTEMCKMAARVKERLEKEGRTVSMIEMEKVAYVLGKEMVDIDGLEGDAAGPESIKPTIKPAAKSKKVAKDEKSPPSPKSGSKRASKSNVRADATRRSKRIRPSETA